MSFNFGVFSFLNQSVESSILDEQDHNAPPEIGESASEVKRGGVCESASPRLAKIPSVFKAVDLFAGIGGIRLGFERAFGRKMKTVFVSEWDKWAQQTYLVNFGNGLPVAGDITRIAATQIPDFDICLAGFPCQAFSMAGRRRGFNDLHASGRRGMLFFEVARICAVKRPLVIFCENVKGLLIHDGGKTMAVMKDTLVKIGYIPFVLALNSKDFGVPQNRERIYIAAFRRDVAPNSFEPPKPSVMSPPKLRDVIESGEVDPKYYLSETYWDTLVKHRRRHEAKGNGFGYVIRSMDGVSGAVVCGGMGRERNLIVDDPNAGSARSREGTKANAANVRRMTPREWARLQGFPDSFKLELADVHLYKQLGNSVTVPVIEAIARRIRKAFADFKKCSGSNGSGHKRKSRQGQNDGRENR